MKRHIKLFEELEDWGPVEIDHEPILAFKDYDPERFRKHDLKIEVGDDHYDFTVAFFDKEMTPEERDEIRKLTPWDLSNKKIPHLIEVRDDYHFGYPYDKSVKINGKEVSIQKIEQEGKVSVLSNYLSWKQDKPKNCKDIAIGWVSSKPGGKWIGEVKGRFDFNKLTIIYDFAPDESEDLIVGFEYDGVELEDTLDTSTSVTSGVYFLDEKDMKL